jgi:signal transduction histidine kinase
VLDMMGRQISVMAHLLDDLLDVARISRGRLELQRKFVTLGDVVRLAVEATRAEVERHGHKLVVNVDDPTISMNVDPVRIAQVITNLLNNAAKYTPRGGRITLTAAREGGEVVLGVEDNGRGMSADDLEKVFTLFARPGQPDAGLGIGLSLARTLVEMHGGTLAAESGGPGRGSRFVARLPAG